MRRIDSMVNYRVWACGEKWGDKDEIVNMLANTPEQAITKLRIIRGESFYRRMYQIAIAPSRNCLYKNYIIIPELSSYGMVKELCRRDGVYH